MNNELAEFEAENPCEGVVDRGGIRVTARGRTQAEADHNAEVTHAKQLKASKQPIHKRTPAVRPKELPVSGMPRRWGV